MNTNTEQFKGHTPSTDTACGFVPEKDIETLFGTQMPACQVVPGGIMVRWQTLAFAAQEARNITVAENDDLRAKVQRLENSHDLLRDEFQRIKATANVSEEIKGLCDRAISDVERRVPLVVDAEIFQNALTRIHWVVLEGANIGTGGVPSADQVVEAVKQLIVKLLTLLRERDEARGKQDALALENFDLIGKVAELTAELANARELERRATAYASRVERETAGFAARLQPMLDEISKLPLGKSIHENLAQAVARVLEERDTARQRAAQLEAKLTELEAALEVATSVDEIARNAQLEGEKAGLVKRLKDGCTVVSDLQSMAGVRHGAAWLANTRQAIGKEGL